MKKIYYLIPIVTILLALGVFALYQKFSLSNKNVPQTETSERVGDVDVNVNLVAGFAIFTNTTPRIFSQPMYLNQSRDVYIQSENPNIVHVKKKDVSWDDFFKTLPFELTKTCLTTGTKQTFCGGQGGSLKFYLNGVLTPDFLSREIQNGDRLLITFGNENESEIQNQLNQVPDPNNFLFLEVDPD